MNAAKCPTRTWWTTWTAASLDPNSPRPSIETLLHAFLPFHSVAHSHADAVVGLTNNKDADAILRRVYGDNIGIVEYLRPGFQLSKLVGLAVKESPNLDGVVLVNHGLFTWGDDARQAYDRHIDLVTKAEEFAASGNGSVFGGWQRNPLAPERRREVAAAVAPTLRGLVSQQRRSVLRYDDADDVLEFTGSEQRASASAPSARPLPTT